MRSWMRKFTAWYNAEQRLHSGIGYHHPTDAHNGTATATNTKRKSVLDAAYQAKPNRFRNKPPTAPPPPAEAWINKPTIHTTP